MRKDDYLDIIDIRIKALGLEARLEHAHWAQRLVSFHRECRDHLSSFKDIQSAVDAFDFHSFRLHVQSLCDVESTNDTYYYLIALSYQLEIDFVQAIAAFKKAMESMRKSLYINECASMYLQLGQFKEAEHLFKQLIKQSVADKENDYQANGWGGLALLYSIQGFYKKAVTTFENAYHFGGSQWDSNQKVIVLLQLAQVLEKSGQLDKALGKVRELTALMPTVTELDTKLTVWIQLGEIYAKSKRQAQAIVSYKKGLDIAKLNNYKPYIQRFESGLGSVYESIHQHENALLHLEQAFLVAKELRDQEAMGYSVYTIALVNEHLGDFQKSRRLFKDAQGLLAPLLEADDPFILNILTHLTR